MNTASASGGFVQALSGERRIVVTATRSPRETERTYFASYFVDAYLDSEANELDSRFRREHFAHTGGHALFTVELLRALRDAGYDTVYLQAAPLGFNNKDRFMPRSGPLASNTTQLATVASPIVWLMSKHSSRSGTSSRPSASCRSSRTWWTAPSWKAR